MKTLALERTAVDAAWRLLVRERRVPEGVRPEIRRSWQRTLDEWRVDPGIAACPAIEHAEEVLASEGAEGLRGAVSDLLAQFAARLAPDGHVLALFDADGVMVDLRGSARTRRRLARVNFAPGAVWSERTAGTNGIGTALVEGRPVEVFASEHYVEAWQSWTCASAPVRFAGRIVGVVDITSPWTARTPSLLLTAEALASAIESRLMSDAAARERETLLQAAQRALRARDEFLAVASHELKTPLTPLRLKIQRVQRLAAAARSGADPDALLSALADADLQVGRLVSFVDALIDAARAVHGPPQLVLETVELGALARSTVDQRSGDLRRHGCEVFVEGFQPVEVRGDRALLEQALRHLLTNAMKYAPGRIEIGLAAADGVARLWVTDHGPGIPPEAADRVFRPFERCVSARNTSGMGLGLHAVRQIVQAHGGTVRVESTAGCGCTFLIELPAPRPGDSSTR